MARIRTVKPEFWTSEQVMNCSRDARLLFIGMWNFCDDGGNHPASAKTLKAEVFPGDDKLETATVMTWVDELIEQDLVSEYEVDSKEFWHVTGWHHQRIDQPTLRHPAGDTGDAVTQGDARHPKRLGGKQRQLLMKKLRDRDGDACHLCGDTSSLTLLKVSGGPAENPHDASLYKLICTTCKRQNRAGDAEVTQSDARYVAGDSNTEGKVGEGKGVESSLSPSSEEQVVDRTTGDAVSPPPAPLSPTIVPNSRGAAISLLMRRAGVEGCNASNPIVQEWASNPAVTDDLLETAAAMAKKREVMRPGPNYLAPIVQQLLTPKPAKPSEDAWRRSDKGIERKASELGIYARPGETHDALRERCESELRRRAQGVAS
jgi:hypothetical protein